MAARGVPGMSASIDWNALASTSTIDITTEGRRSGRPARIEIWWFHVEDRFIITGTPGPRDWYANVVANPALTVHAYGADIDATATVVNDIGFRRRFFTHPQTSWYRSQSDLDHLIAESPMIEVQFTPSPP